MAAPAAWAVNSAYDGPDGGTWDNNFNWANDTFGEPQAIFAEQALINTGVNVVVNTDQSVVSPGGADPQNGSTGGVLLGTTGNTGSLTIASGGNLLVRVSDVSNGEQTSGTVEIGRGSRGFLNVQPGGIMTAEHILLGGPAGTPAAPESKITVGGTVAGAATLTVRGETSLRRTTEVIGPNANFTSFGAVTLANTHTLNAHITGATHSPIKATVSGTPVSTGTGHAYVDGTLKMQFTGVVPALGNSWNLIDAQTIHGAFSSVDSSHASAALTGGKGYGTRVVNGGTNGKLLQVVVEQFLTLQVNRSTGQVAIRNTAAAAGGANDVSITGYQIESQYDSLTSGGWNSLQDQGVAGWQEATPQTDIMGELKSTGGGTPIPGNSSRALGNIFTQAFPAFGTPVNDDITFTYSTSDGLRQGFIELLGTEVTNNLRVHVNPATGGAQLFNDSPHTINIEGYTITSPTNQLIPGTWNSLDDQNVHPNIVEAAPTNHDLSELVTAGALTLTGGQVYSLGTIHPVAGTQNLTFEFLMQGAPDAQPGLVTYGPPIVPPPANDADFDNDGDTDGADFLTWQRGLGVGTTNAQGDANASGSVNGADLAIWRTRFGMPPATAAVGAVPEPATALLAALGCGFFWRRPRRREEAVIASLASATNNSYERSNDMPRSGVRTGLISAVAGLLALAAVAATQTTQAADILLVSRPAQFGAPDDQLITLLKSFGHNVVNEGDVPLNLADFNDALPTAAELAGVDMILISRNANSGDYTTNAAETAGWNAITTPILLMNPQLSRGGHATLGNNRFGLVNMEATTTVDNYGSNFGVTSPQILPSNYDAYPNAAHPFVAGRGTDVFFNGESMDYLNRVSTNWPATSVTVANMTINGAEVAALVDIPAGSTLFTNAQGVVDPLGGRRVVMQMIEYPDTHDVFRVTANGGQIINQIINTITSSAPSMIAGDVNGDNAANIADFNLIRMNFGATVDNRNQGDLSGDSFVDLADLRLWKAVAAPADIAAAVIPEPAGFALALVGIASAAAVRRRRTRCG